MVVIRAEKRSILVVERTSLGHLMTIIKMFLSTKRFSHFTAF